MGEEAGEDEEPCQGEHLQDVLEDQGCGDLPGVVVSPVEEGDHDEQQKRGDL